MNLSRRNISVWGGTSACYSWRQNEEMWTDKTSSAREQHENPLQKHLPPGPPAASFFPSSTLLPIPKLPPPKHPPTTAVRVAGSSDPGISYALLPTSTPSSSSAPSGGGAGTRGMRVQSQQRCFVRNWITAEKFLCTWARQLPSCSALPGLHKPARWKCNEGKRRQKEWRGLRCPD